jgi:inhibitor of cysteine peptidase
MLKRQLPVILLALATLSCASPGHLADGGEPPTLEINQDAAGSTVKLAKGQKLALTLPGNPTTGYVWELVPGAETVLAQLGKPEYTAAGGKLGAGGVYRFLFKARQGGRATLKLVYQRPFETGRAPVDSFEVQVVVGE